MIVATATAHWDKCFHPEDDLVDIWVVPPRRKMIPKF
jgi:hypothetical protein